MKDKNNLSRVGFDSRSVRDWIGYCLGLPGKWKLITSLLLLLTLGIGQVWGDTEYTFINQSDGKYTGGFYTGRAESNVASDAKAIKGLSCTYYVTMAGTGAPGVSNIDRYIKYDVKTTATQIIVYFYTSSGSNRSIKLGEIKEGNTSFETIREKTIKNTGDTLIYNTTNTTNSTIYITVPSNAGDIRFYQVKAIESGDALLKAGEGGYELNLNKGRIALKKDETTIIDGITIYKPSAGYTAASTESLSIPKSVGGYLLFTTPASPGKLKLTYSGGQMAYNTSASASEATSITSGSEYTLSGSTPYYIFTTAASGSTITKIEFVTATAVCPSGISISGTTSYAEGQTITLNAAKEAGNGEITYTWYKGADLSAAKTAGSIGTGASFTKENCTTGDAGMYWCVATKTSCDEAASSGYTVSVSEATKYDVAFAAGTGASGEMTTLKRVEGATVTIPAPTFTAPSGKYFSNWSIAGVEGKTSGQIGETFDMPAGNVTLTATWVEELSGNVVFNVAVKNTAASQTTTMPFYISGLVGETSDGAGTVSDISKTDRSGKFATNCTSGKGVKFAFEVKDGFEFTPTAVAVQLASVSTTDFTFTATLSDENSNVLASNEVSPTSDGTLTTITFPAYNKSFKGTVTLLLSACRSESGTYRIGKPITITGTLAVEVTKYNLTFAKGDEGADGTMTTLKYAEGAEVTLPACTFTAPTNKTFDAWVVTKTVGGASITVTDGKFTMPAEAVTATATWKNQTVKNAITKGSHEHGDFTIDPTTESEGETVTLVATPDEGYLFSAWEVVKTSDASATGISVNANGEFTMPAYAVTINATFVADPRKKILYLTSDGNQTNDITALFATYSANYNVTQRAAQTNAQDYSNYDLIVLDESLNGGSAATENHELRLIKGVAKPILNLKAYFYTATDRWNWGAPNNGKKNQQTITFEDDYCNVASHPIYAGLTSPITVTTYSNNENKKGKTIQGVTSLVNNNGYKLGVAVAENETDELISIHELTPTQRNVTSGKYLMIALGSEILATGNLTADAKTLLHNAIEYLLDGDASWTPTAPLTVTHTLANVTKKSGEASVCAGVAYSATYEAVSGYTLPADVVVKVNGTAINSGYTWTQATGTLAIEAAQVTNNIEIVVNGEFNCPAASSGDIVFKWDAKTGSAEAEYLAAEAEGVDISGYVDNMVGGSAKAYAQVIGEGPNTTWYRNTDNCLYFNGNSAYLKLNVCALQEGDKIEIASAEGKNIWIATSSTRPADASAAAAVIEHGSAFYISSTSALIDATEIYLFREDDFTKIGSLTITRSKKFTVTYDSSEPLTGGATPAPEYAFDGQSLVIVDGTTMENGAKHFNGWKDSNDNDYAVGANFTPTANITLYAQWAECTPLTLNLTGYATELLAGGATTTATLDKGTSTGAVTWESSNTEVLTVANGVITPMKGGTATVTAHVAEDATYCENDITSAEITVKATVHYDANAGNNETGTMEDGVGASVTVVANGFAYADHKFLRWNTQPDGLGTDVAVGATTNENMTLYAIWKEVSCPASGTVYSMSLGSSIADNNLAAGDSVLLVDGSNATITKGMDAYLKNAHPSDAGKAQISSKRVLFNGDNAVLALVMDCELAAGDTISFLGGESDRQFVITPTKSNKPKDEADKVTTTDYKYIVGTTDTQLIGASVLYVGRVGSATYMTGVTVTRPAPDAPVPSITTNPATASYTGNDPILPMTVAAEVTGATDLHYQWYKVGDPSDVEVGDDAASYTPIASGEYYCVVTNSPTGYTAKSATSAHATITMVSSDATLAWLKAGDDDITLSAGVYDYEYVLADDATVAPTITAGKNEENATVTITQASEKTGTARVHVVAQDNTTEHTYTVKFNEFVCAKATTVFTMEVGDTKKTYSVRNASGYDKELEIESTYATYSHGAAYAGTVYTSGNRSVKLDEKNNEVQFKFDNDDFFMKLDLTCALKAGDVISFTSTMDKQIAFTATDVRSTTNATEDKSYTVTATDGLVGKDIIYIWRVSAETAIKTITISRAAKPDVTGIAISEDNIAIMKNETHQLTAEITPSGADQTVIWESSDPSVATVDANGLVKGIAVGTAVITATSDYEPSFTRSCDVTVSALDCETYVGNLFTMDVTGTASLACTYSTEVSIADYVDVTFGDAYVGHDATKNNNIILDASQSSTKQVKLENIGTYVKVVLSECAIKAGDVITITSTGSNEFCFTADATYDNSSKTKNKKYMVKPTDTFVGSNTLYVWRAQGSNTYLGAITIDRVPPFDANRTSLKVNSYGTFCYPQAVAEGMYTGATFYRILEKTGIGFILEEVRSLEAGRPYMFVAEANTIYVDWSGDAVTEPVNDAQNYGLVGANFVDDYTPVPSYYDGHNCYILSNNHIYLCGNNCQIAKYRAYIDYDAVPEAGQGTPGNVPAGAPALRRIVVGKDNATAIDNLTEFGNGATATKLIIDGQMYILRGGHIFDATGRLVK